VIVLGINAYHGDSSACILLDGRLVAAAEEERFRRIKHWAGFPSEAIRYCLAAAGVGPGGVDCVAVNRDPSANLWRKIAFAATRFPSPSQVASRARNAARIGGIEEALKKEVPGPWRAQIRRVEHHRAHLASAFLVSPFERAAVVSVDGFGDFVSTMWGVGEGSRLRVLEEVHFPHSLGLFYLALTQHLGFPKYGDEYKVMGLAPYGRPSRTGELRRVLRLEPRGRFRLDLRYFLHHASGVSMVWENGEPSIGRAFSPELERLLGPARKPDEPIDERHKDLAASVQEAYEEAFFHVLRRAHERSCATDLALAGGCAMNSVANGKVYANTPFKRLYAQSAAGDAGGAIGAAFFAVNHDLGRPRAFVMDHAFWGPEFDEAEIAAEIAGVRDELREQGCTVTAMPDDASLCEAVAADIENGSVVGWFQGRMEWGPRALGNRSILGDPRRADMKDILNIKIKRRESFRPFAPSVLRERTAEWFETDDDVPFMLQVYQIREVKRALVPAVTHVNGSGRLQTVTAAQNPLYHRLISAFEAKTGVPMLLNTSFNENEPVVCRPREALDCFLRTRMDVLALGRRVIRREA